MPTEMAHAQEKLHVILNVTEEVLFTYYPVIYSPSLVGTPEIHIRVVSTVLCTLFKGGKHS